MYVEYALETGNFVKLPMGFGEICVGRKKFSIYKEHLGKKYVNLKID